MCVLRSIGCSGVVLCAAVACGPAVTSPESEWTRTYGGTSSYQASTVRVTADGGYLVAGTVMPPSFTDADVWLLRLEPGGNIAWQKTYGGEGWDMFKSLEPTADGGFVVAGSTESFGAGATDAWVLKLDGNGNVVWQWTFGGAGTDSANSVQQTTDGGYVVAGSMSGPGGYDRTWVLKLDASGGVVWQRQYGSGAAASVTQSADGGYVVAASNSLDPLKTGTDYWVLKLDGSGNVAWSKEYPGWIASIQPIGDAHFVVAGYVHSPSDIYKIDPWVMKLDSSGNVVWQRYIPDEGGRDTFSTAQPTPDGGYVVVGSTSPNEDGATSVRVLKLGSDGAVPDCANLAPYDRTPSDSGVIKGNTAEIAVAAEVTPAISHAVPNESTAMLVRSCGSAANSTGRNAFR